MFGNRNAQYAVRMDFAADMSREAVAAVLRSGRAAGLSGFVNIGLAERFEALLDSGEDELYAEVRDGEKDRDRAARAAALVKGFAPSVIGTKGWKDAQVTAGGVPLNEVAADTMESLILNKLYFAGEVLDYDGPSGGYNLDWAWNTGARAGESAAREARG
jgi:predicted flavoprotein YhiN